MQSSAKHTTNMQNTHATKQKKTITHATLIELKD